MGGAATRPHPAVVPDTDHRHFEPHGLALPVVVIVRGPGAGSRYALRKQYTRVGRIADCDIVLDDVSVSRRHAVLERTPDGATLFRDCGSLNGSYVDGRRVEECALDDRAELIVGRFWIVYYAPQT